MTNATERTCALCQLNFTSDHYTVLCEPCQQVERERVRRMGALGEVVSYASNTVAAARRLAHDFPEAGILIDQMVAALAEPLDALTTLRNHMREQDRQRDAQIYAAHEQARSSSSAEGGGR